MGNRNAKEEVEKNLRYAIRFAVIGLILVVIGLIPVIVAMVSKSTMGLGGFGLFIFLLIVGSIFLIVGLTWAIIAKIASFLLKNE